MSAAQPGENLTRTVLHAGERDTVVVVRPGGRSGRVDAAASVDELRSLGVDVLELTTDAMRDAVQHRSIANLANVRLILAFHDAAAVAEALSELTGAPVVAVSGTLSRHSVARILEAH